MIKPYVEAAEGILKERPSCERRKRIEEWRAELRKEGGNPITAALAVRKRIDATGEDGLWLILATNALLKQRRKQP